MNKRKHYYVVVDGRVVYKIDNATRTAFWAKPNEIPAGEKPLDLCKTTATDLCEALIMNLYNAHIEVYYWEMPFEVKK